MKFSENWLRQHVNPDLDSEQLAHVLTMAGLEVEELEAVAPAFSGVVVAEILSAEKHPDADRLQVCRVKVGEGELLQIVCGAPNARAGLKAPCALVGARLPGFDIKQAKVRGVESFGMMCSAKELGLAEESGGLLELPADAPTGRDIRAYLDLNDRLITLKLTPNRSDCLSLIGVARDVAALTGAPLLGLEIQPVAGEARQHPVAVAEPAACPRYCGRIVSGVNASAKTPDWLLRRLERGGIRSISAIVDITNYVLLEMGQPLHAFDLTALAGGIRVRYAVPGESIRLLNGQAVELQADMLVIADSNGAVALAGIMGGEATAVSDKTVDIFLESAFFLPGVIAGKARRLGLSTDSSYRFERGVDFVATRQALERATQLVLEICGGIAGAVTEVAADLPVRSPVALRMPRVSAVLGVALDEPTITGLLQRLQFAFTQEGDRLLVTPPSYRYDIAIEEDLIEEIARLHGYEHVPALPPASSLQMLPAPGNRVGADSLRQRLAGADYQEIVSYSFVDEMLERNLQANTSPIRLRNPIASNMGVMRSSLWGGLLEAALYNLNRKQDRIRLFEMGACFYASGEGYREITRIAGLSYGSVVSEQWASATREVDFFDVKADIEKLAPERLRFEAAEHPALHPGQSARVLCDGQPVGWLGSLHPQWQTEYQLPRATVLFELEAAPLMQTAVPSFTTVPKFPPVRRDLAFVVDQALPFQQLLDAMRGAASESVKQIALFDQYTGKGVPEGKKSLAFLVVMQDTQRTLTDNEVDAEMARLVATAASGCGAELRS